MALCLACELTKDSTRRKRRPLTLLGWSVSGPESHETQTYCAARMQELPCVDHRHRSFLVADQGQEVLSYEVVFIILKTGCQKRRAWPNVSAEICFVSNAATIASTIDGLKELRFVAFMLINATHCMHVLLGSVFIHRNTSFTGIWRDGKE